MIYAVDPSTVATGVAIFLGTRLDRVTVLEAEGLDEMIEAVRAYFYGHPITAECVVEVPIAYGFKQKGDPNDLLKIAQVAGAVRAHFATSYAITPGGWNGGRPKKITEARIRSLLLPDEVAMLDTVRVAVRHNAIDAVGVGMHHLKTLLR